MVGCTSPRPRRDCCRSIGATIPYRQGLAHCRAGVGPNTEFDSLTPLLKWVEDGVAPETLAAGVKPTRDAQVQTFLGSERFGPHR